MFFDSQCTLHLTQHQVSRKKIKHINVKLHFIHDIVSKEVISMEKIFTEDNPIDMLTKALPTAKLHWLDLVNIGPYKGHLKIASN